MRSVNDTLGVLRNTKVLGDGVVGDLQVSARHAWLLEDAERMPGAFCLSIDGSGKVRRGEHGEPDLVESLPILKRVDVVSVGGTTKSLFEAHGQGAGANTEASADELLDALTGRD